MPSASSTSKIRLSWLRKSSGVSRLLALYSTHCSCRNVFSPRSKATAACVGFSSRSTLISIAVNPYTALVGWPVVVAKFSAGSAKNARYASECPSSSSNLSRDATVRSYAERAGRAPRGRGARGWRAGGACGRGRSGGEGVDGGGGEGVAGLQLGRREVGLVGRVREVLRLEGVGEALPVAVAADAGEGAVQEVAGVELDAGLVGPHGELTAAARVVGAGGEVQAVRPGGRPGLPVQHPVEVVALRDQQLVVPGRVEVRAHVVDPGAHRERAGEVHRRAEHGRLVAERDLGGVGRGVPVGVDLDELVVGRARGRALAGQVEVVVVGQVDDRVEVGRLVGGD